MQPIKFATLVIILLHILTIHKFLSLHCQNTLPKKFLSPFNLRSLRENQPLMKARTVWGFFWFPFCCCNKCWFHTQWEVPSYKIKLFHLIRVSSLSSVVQDSYFLCFHEIINWHNFLPFLWAKKISELNLSINDLEL